MLIRDRDLGVLDEFVEDAFNDGGIAFIQDRFIEKTVGQPRQNLVVLVDFLNADAELIGPCQELAGVIDSSSGG